MDPSSQSQACRMSRRAAFLRMPTVVVVSFGQSASVCANKKHVARLLALVLLILTLLAGESLGREYHT